MATQRIICAVTGSRAEFGLLRWTLSRIIDDPHLDLQLVVTGAHLDPRSGGTWREIVDLGFEISAKVDMRLSGDDARTITHSLGLATTGFGQVFDQMRPDILLLLGDRYEILAAAQAAMLARIPIAHLHGGESTEGLIDEAIRHSVTKMAHIHCVAAETYARRVIQMGEQPESVHVVGATGLDAIKRLSLLDRASLQNELGYPISEKHLLVTYHPVTLAGESAERAIAPLIDALQRQTNSTITITAANADPLGQQINALLMEFARKFENIHFIHSLGQLRYLSLAKISGAIVGNSSSGLIEIPSLGVPTVNIGDRQRNRLRANSVIDCANQSDAIANAIDTALSPEFMHTVDTRSNPYGEPGAANRISRILRDTPLENILFKHFYDLEPAT